MKVWRVFLRLQRATLARAVLLARRSDGAVLALSTDSNELMLPTKNLNGWEVVTTQVEDLVDDAISQRQTPRLVAVLGTPSRSGVTFVFSAEIPASASGEVEGIWLQRPATHPLLRASDRELLLKGQG